MNIQPLPIYSNFSASTIGNMEYHSALRSQEIQHHGSLLLDQIEHILVRLGDTLESLFETRKITSEWQGTQLWFDADTHKEEFSLTTL